MGSQQGDTTIKPFTSGHSWKRGGREGGSGEEEEEPESQHLQGHASTFLNPIGPYLPLKVLPFPSGATG